MNVHATWRWLTLAVLLVMFPASNGQEEQSSLMAESFSGRSHGRSFEVLGLRSIADLMPGHRAGELPNSRALKTWYSQHLDAYVALDPAAGWSDDDATAAFTALLRLRAARPELFGEIFFFAQEGRASLLTRPLQGRWRNRNKTAIFVVISAAFHAPNKRSLASNLYSLQRDVDAPTDGDAIPYLNVPFVNLDPEVIAGQVENVGPGLIFPTDTAARARERFFGEVLALALLHERLHGYISQFADDDALFRALRASGQPPCLYQAEELLVLQFTLDQLAGIEGVLDGDALAYWLRVRDVLRDQVEATACFQQLRDDGLLTAGLLRAPSSH